MPITVPCPYCNAPVPVTAGERRVTCPRCEETVTIRDGDTGSSSTAESMPVERPAAARPANRAVAGIVVALMLGMAALGLAFALRTQPFRRANDSKGVQEPDPVA